MPADEFMHALCRLFSFAIFVKKLREVRQSLRITPHLQVAVVVGYMSKSNLDTRGVTPKRVTSGGVHLGV